MTQNEYDNLKVRNVSIICTTHPEWGTWGVYERKDGYLEIHAERRDRVLFEDEALRDWEIVR